MQFLYLSANQTWDEDICISLSRLGQKVTKFSFPEEINSREFVILSEINRNSLVEVLQKKEYDFVFSTPYIHEVSMFCNVLGVLYLSWTMEYPTMDLLRDSVQNPCNCFFISDKAEIERLQKKGIENVFYLPPAAGGAERKEKEEKKYSVSYIGKVMEADENSIFSSQSPLTIESRGYLDGLVHCQRVVYGMNLLDSAIPANVVSELARKYPLQIPLGVTEDLRNLYLKKWIYNRVSSQERIILLQGNDKEVTVFSKDENMHKFFSKTKVINEETERTKIIEDSKINLHIMDRQIQDGFSLNVMEIMACGGFLLCNYCPAMEEFFVPDEDYVYFEDETDLKKKIEFYLQDEEERKRIAKNGFEKVQKEHLIFHRIEQMLKILY